jgi:AmmeMemoRadiSam system protein A
MPSLEPAFALAAAERSKLLALARAAIAVGRDAPWLGPDLAGLPPALRAPGASFVTLHRHGELRGCIGSLEPHRPLAEDVAGNARAAAFMDPRFPPVGRDEVAGLELEISVLSPLTPLAAASEAELLAALRPGTDGLVLVEGARRATFLPAVWRQLPEPRSFLAHLKHKAGLPADHWSPAIRFLRYTVEEFA